jgi:hypothetical protein
MALRAGALSLLLLGCGGDDDSACLPASLAHTCVAQLSSEIQMCFDAQGSCTKAYTDGGVAYEWKNGARYEIADGPDGSLRAFSSDGDECMRTSGGDAEGCVRTSEREHVHE